MAKYIVKSRLKYKGKRHEPGTSVEVADDVAKPLVDDGTLEAPKATAKVDDKK